MVVDQLMLPINFMPPSLIVICFLLVTNIVAFGGWKLTAGNLNQAKQDVATCRANHEAFIAQTKAQGELAAQRAKTVEQNHRRIADETATGWAKALDVVRADAARRVRFAAAASSAGRAMPGISPPAAGVDAAAEGALPPAERIIADCQEDTLKLMWLQHWVNETREIRNE